MADTADAFVSVVAAADDAAWWAATFNAGSGHEISVGDTVGLIGEVMGVEVEAVLEDEQRSARPDPR